MSLCPEWESKYRESLDDGDFWAYVLQGIKPGEEPEPDYGYEPEVVEVQSPTPCSICGEFGPCAYDAENNPMVHVQPEDDEIERF